MIINGCRVKSNLSGITYNRWTVLGPVRDNNNKVKWHCRCSCGIERLVIYSGLVSGTSKSCGCFLTDLLKTKKFSYYENSSRQMWMKTYRDIPYDIFLKLSQDNCHYCGSAPSNFFNKHKNIPDGDFIYNGLDRIDSSLGHTIDNCVTCCKYCNFAKGNRSYEDYIKWLSKCNKWIKLQGLLNEN